MITHATRPPQSLQCDVLILTELVHTIRKPIHNVNESVCHVTTPSKESHSKYAEIAERNKTPRASKWYHSRAQSVFGGEIKVQFPAKGSACAALAMAPSSPGQSWVDGRHSVPGTRVLGLHQVEPSGSEGLKWKSGPNDNETNQSISSGNFN